MNNGNTITKMGSIGRKKLWEKMSDGRRISKVRSLLSSWKAEEEFMKVQNYLKSEDVRLGEI